MSTFKEISENTITNTGELINGRLVYTLLGGNMSQPVYFGLKDTDNNWNGNLVSKGTSAFYLTSDTSGCTAQIKESTSAPTTADANTAREIWLNIPKATSSRTIHFSYNGTTVLTINQNLRSTYNVYIVEPERYSVASTDISSPVYYLTQDNNYNEEYISRSEGNNINLQQIDFQRYFILLLDANINEFQSSFNLLSGSFTFKYLTDNYNLTYVSGDAYNFDGVIDDYICSFARGMYDSEQDTYINNLYQETSYNGSTIYIWNPANMQIYDETFILTGQFRLDSINFQGRIGKYTIEL